MKFLISILLIPFITSCNSFNTIALSTYELSINNEYPLTKNENNLPNKNQNNVEIKEVVKYQYKYVCPKFIMPTIPPAPEFPARELLELNPEEEEKVDRILMNYIMRIKEHDKKARSLIDTEYNKYLKKCP